MFDDKDLVIFITGVLVGLAFLDGVGFFFWWVVKDWFVICLLGFMAFVVVYSCIDALYRLFDLGVLRG